MREAGPVAGQEEMSRMAAVETEGGDKGGFCSGAHRFGAEPGVERKAGEGERRIQNVSWVWGSMGLL